MTRLDQLVEFRAEHDAWPRKQKSDVPEGEAVLGNWLSTQRTAKKRGDLTAERRNLLNERAAAWDKGQDLEQQWLARLDDLVAFRVKHGTFPRRDRRAGVPKSEATLGSWLKTQRTMNEIGKLTAERRELLEDRVPGWDDSFEQRWLMRLDDLVAFRAEHGSWPRTFGTARPDSERVLGDWLAVQRTRPPVAERRHLLDTRTPGWLETRQSQHAWFTRLDDLVAFRARHAFWPRQGGPGVPEREKTLGKWLGRQRTASGQGRLATERRQTLDAWLPGWLPEAGTHYSKGQYLAKLDDVVAFRAEHGTWPRKQGPGVPEGEAALGTWLNTQRKANTRGDLTTERQNLLDTRAPGWEQGQDLEQQWLAKLDGLVVFRTEHGTLPRSGGANLPQQEKTLGVWLSVQRTANKEGKLTAERRQLLDTRTPGWAETWQSERWWLARLDDLVAFRANHDAWPRVSGADRSEREKTLGTWLNNQRTARRRGKLSGERQNLLDKRAPGWSETRKSETRKSEQWWLARLNDLVAFRAEHGAWPRKLRDGVPEDEGVLGTWLNTQRKAKTRGDLTTERQNLLDTRAPGWEQGQDLDQQWLSKLGDLVAFRAEHGAWPRTGGADRSEREKTLGNWLDKQRSMNTCGDLTAERQDLLDTWASGWSQPRYSEGQWLARLDQVVTFRAEHGTWPRKTGPGVVQDEGDLGVWLSWQRQVSMRGELTAERRQLLDERAPGWEQGQDLDQQWLSKLGDLVAFRAEHGTWPRTGGADRSEREKTLGTWLNNQRTARRRGKLSGERRRLLDEQVPGWLSGSRG